ncbi:MAG: hypothetical protein LKJ88_04715 [Bacilli bacterium]|jgi:replication initiation and membrane attachment protein|nr:hypothetical protein [Bacilli bacterium]
MLTLEDNALVSIRAGFLLSEDEEELLVGGYLPFITPSAFALYHLLMVVGRNKDNYCTALDLSEKMSAPLSSIRQSMLFLEGAGLVATYRHEEKGKVFYILRLFRPLSPDKFFKNPLFVSLLAKKISERRVNDLVSSFMVGKPIGEEYTDISARFNEVYEAAPDFTAYHNLSGSELLAALSDSKEEQVAFFSEDKFLEALVNLSIPASSVQADLKEICRLCSLYGVDEKTASELIKDGCLNSDSIFSLATFKKKAADYAHFAFKGIKGEEEEVFGTSDMAKRLSLYQTLSPLTFLAYLLNAEPTKSYKELLDKLSSTYQAPNSFINLVVDYTLQCCQGFLPEEFAVKTMISLKKNKIATVADGLAFLFQSQSDIQAKKARKKELYKYQAPDEEENKDKEEETDKKEPVIVDYSALMGDD